MSDLTRNGRKDRAMRDLTDLMRCDSEILDDISDEFAESVADNDGDQLTAYYYRIMSTVAGLLSQAHAVRPSLRMGR